MKEIKLTQGKVALVDDEDYKWLSKWKWAARRANSFLENWYAVRSPEMIKGKRGTAIKMHNQVTGRKPGQTDHRDGNGLNNQRSNLRACGQDQNNFNRRKQRRVTSSKYKGVSWGISVNKWRACIQRNKNLHHIGYFKSEEEAARRYDAIALQFFGEFASLNFPTELK